MLDDNKLAALITDAHTAVLITAHPSVRFFAGAAAPAASALLAWQGGAMLFPSFPELLKEGLRPLAGALPLTIACLETEPDALTVAQGQQLESALNIQVDFSDSLQKRIYLMRLHKNPAEVALIRQAQGMADRAFMELLNFIRVGMTDWALQKLMADLLWQEGSQSTNMSHVIGCGPDTADPHVRPSGREIKSGDLVMIDIGATIDGYGCDMTRMISMGSPDEEKMQIYNLVFQAQSAGMAAARAGAVCRQVDAAARDVIVKAGYGGYFPHGLGHPIGTGGHEGPRFAPGDTSILPAHIVMTVEPGIYLPGRFGIRLENMLYIHEHGAEDLTGVPRELFVV